MPLNEYMQFPNIDPVLFSIGPLAIHWYGVMYLLGFAFALWWGGRQAERSPDWTRDKFSDLIFWCFLGVLIGGRIGYVIFYCFQLDTKILFYSVNIQINIILLIIRCQFFGIYVEHMLSLSIFDKTTNYESTTKNHQIRCPFCNLLLF